MNETTEIAVKIMTGLVVGLLLWTLIEYVVHRWAGHRKLFGRQVRKEHLSHHAQPDHFTSFAKKLVLAVPIVGAIAAGGVVVLGWGGAAVAVGTLAGWTFYEQLHRATHVRGPRNRYGVWARRHHLHHHFENPHANHGVTSPFWDVVFGTRERPAMVRVPRRHVHCFAWILDDTGVVKGEHVAEYRVV